MAVQLLIENLQQHKHISLLNAQYLNVINGDAITIKGRDNFKFFRKNKDLILKNTQGEEFFLKDFYANSQEIDKRQLLNLEDPAGKHLQISNRDDLNNPSSVEVVERVESHEAFFGGADSVAASKLVDTSICLRHQNIIALTDPAVVVAATSNNFLIGLGAVAAGAVAKLEFVNSSHQITSVLNTTIDAIAPIVSGAPFISEVIGEGGTLLSQGDVITVTVHMSEDVIVTGVPSIDMVIGEISRKAFYDAASSTAKSMVFEYTIADNDFDTSGGIAITPNSLNLNGGTIADLVGNSSILSHTEGVVNSYVVNGADPAITISNAVYDTATNTMTVYGAGFINLLNDVHAELNMTDIKPKLDWSKLSWDFDAINISYAQSFALADINSATVNSSTQMTISLSDAFAANLEANHDYMTNGSNVYDSLRVLPGFVANSNGNQFIADSSNIGIGIHLGTYGNLVFPVLVEGKNYYYWDRSGNADANDLQGAASDYATDYSTINWIETEFSSVGLNGGTMTENNRTWTMADIFVRLPTYGSTVDQHGFANDLGHAPDTAAENTNIDPSYYQSGLNSNPNYNDMLAIRDQFYGGMNADADGTPLGWKEEAAYWSSTHFHHDNHASINLNSGNVNIHPDFKNAYLALEVLPILG